MTVKAGQSKIHSTVHLGRLPPQMKNIKKTMMIKNKMIWKEKKEKRKLEHAETQTTERKQKNTGSWHGIINWRSTEARVMKGYWSLCVCVCVCCVLCVWWAYCVQKQNIKVNDGDTVCFCETTRERKRERHDPLLVSISHICTAGYGWVMLVF